VTHRRQGNENDSSRNLADELPYLSVLALTAAGLLVLPVEDIPPYRLQVIAKVDLVFSIRLVL
jgi:hypothetical protein